MNSLTFIWNTDLARKKVLMYRKASNLTRFKLLAHKLEKDDPLSERLPNSRPSCFLKRTRKCVRAQNQNFYSTAHFFYAGWHRRWLNKIHSKSDLETLWRRYTKEPVRRTIYENQTTALLVSCRMSGWNTDKSTDPGCSPSLYRLRISLAHSVQYEPRAWLRLYRLEIESISLRRWKC